MSGKTDFSAEEFRARREKVIEAIGDQAVAVVQGTDGAQGLGACRQYNEFYYLCGVETPHAYLVVNGKSRRSTLFLPHAPQGEAENTHMGWKNPERSTVGKDWGEAPTRVEGIPARITLPYPAKAVEVWPLDERGQGRVSFVAEAGAKGDAVVAIGPERRTIWYEIVAM